MGGRGSTVKAMERKMNTTFSLIVRIHTTYKHTHMWNKHDYLQKKGDDQEEAKGHKRKNEQMAKIYMHDNIKMKSIIFAC